MLRLVLAATQNTGARHYFYGTTEENLAALRQAAAQQYPGLCIAGTHAPPFRPLSAEEEAEDIRRIREAKPDYLWVALGAPRQDYWVARHAARPGRHAGAGGGRRAELFDRAGAPRAGVDAQSRAGMGLPHLAGAEAILAVCQKRLYFLYRSAERTCCAAEHKITREGAYYHGKPDLRCLCHAGRPPGGRRRQPGQRRYYRCIVVALASAKLANPDCDVALVTNAPVPRPYAAQLEAAGVQVLDCPFDHYRVDAALEWSLAFYKLCAMEWVLAHTAYARCALLTWTPTPSTPTPTCGVKPTRRCFCTRSPRGKPAHGGGHQPQLCPAVRRAAGC